MLISDRHQKILNILQEEKSVSNKKLIETLYVSEATLRRDLSKMEQKGLLQRTHGGATIIESPTNESSLMVREQKQIKEKRKICIKCYDFIQDNSSYFIDSSSTVSHLLPYFNNFKDITAITNGLHNAMILTQTTRANVYITSGVIYTKTNSILGSDTIDYINNFNCNAFIFSCGGVSPQGVTEANFEQRLVKRAMLKNSKIHILLVDHTKFGKIYLSRTCGFEEIDYIITDQMPSPEYLEIFKQTKTKVIVA